MFPTGRLLVTDRRGQILMSSGHGLSVADTAKWRLPPNADLLQFTDRNYHVTIKRVPRLEWNLISAVPVHTLYKLPRTLIALTIVLSVCSMLISAFLAYRTTKKNYLQALRIVRILDTADNLNPAVHGSGTSGEIRNVYDLISKNILEKFLEQKYLKIQLSERKYKEEAAQLKALQSQINPHFLYNTLNSIYWKSFQLTRSENAACRMVEHLTDLLEYAVRDPEGTVSLEEELANVDSYIALQRHRYPERFRVIRDDRGIMRPAGS